MEAHGLIVDLPTVVHLHQLVTRGIPMKRCKMCKQLDFFREKSPAGDLDFASCGWMEIHSHGGWAISQLCGGHFSTFWMIYLLKTVMFHGYGLNEDQITRGKSEKYDDIPEMLIVHVPWGG